MKGLVHADHRAAHVDHRVRSCWCCASRLLICAPTPLQRLGFGSHVNVDHAANLVVVDFGRRVDLVDVGHRAEGDVAAESPPVERCRDRAASARFLHRP